MPASAHSPHGATPPPSTPAWWASAALMLAVSLTAAVALALMLGGLDAGVRAASVLVKGAPIAIAWMVMAFGFGCPLRRLLDPSRRTDAAARRPWGAAIQLTLGVAAALWLDVVLGSLGVLTIPAVAWGMIIVGVVMALLSLRFTPAPTTPVDRLVIAALPAVAVLFLASASTPGWLWSTEFGGYDALSYHLELPKQWLHDGGIGAAAHNVYGHLPSFFEGAFLHLMALGGDAHGAAPACQMLHALIALAAGWATGCAAAAWGVAGREARRVARRQESISSADDAAAGVAAALGAALVLVTPWIVVVGSLAYSELVTVLMLGAGLALLGSQLDSERVGDSLDDAGAGRSLTIRGGVALGLLAGAACGAKLTAAGFVAIPLALTALLCWKRSRTPLRPFILASAAGAVTFFIVLAPWLLRNAITTGNPLFPFATSTFGLGAWTSEQAAIFAQGHTSDLSIVGRGPKLWDQWLRFGFGPAPTTGDAWAPQWGVLPWGGIVAIALLLTLRPAPGRAGDDGSRAGSAVGAMLALVLLAQLGFWLLFTHLQSRFLIPTVVPLAIACSIAIGIRARRSVGIALLLLSLLPVIVFLRERDGAPLAALDAAEIFTGEFIEQAMPRLTSEEQHALRSGAPTAWWLNHALDGAQVLLLGDARPFWYRGTPATFVWQTTWDRGPFSAALAASDDPHQWSSMLLDAGFTHVLVEPDMLDRWERSRWNDPLLTAAAALRLAEPPNRVLASSPGGVLIELRRE